jgi:hypothetical protein
VARPSRRTGLVSAALIAALLIAGNVAGLVRYPGGPLVVANADWPLWLDHRAADQGYNKVGLAAATTGLPVYVGVDLRNQWPLAATIEGVRLINLTPGLRLVEARLIRPGSSVVGVGVVSGSGPELDELGLYSDYQHLPAELGGNSPISDSLMWIEVIADQPGEQSFDSVVVDYRVGPFSFTVDMYQAFSACVLPMPNGAVCSWDAD